MTANPVLLYLHGFLSSPKSQKAQQTLSFCVRQGLAGRVLVPELNQGPAQTAVYLRELIAAQPDADFMVMGSSLGGYYATYLAEEFGLPAVLINPAVRPWEYWRTHLGEHRNYYSGEIHVVTEQSIRELRALERSPLRQPENFRVYLQTGDETLDYRRALEKYSEQHCVVRQNGSHSYDNFVSELPDMLDFLLSRIENSAR